MSMANDNPDSAEITLPQDDLATRKTLGPYELKRKLGQGGMGAVYLAVDPSLKRQVALKILPREKASNPQLVKRFKAEAQNASQLTHENIVSVYGAGEADGYLYIALEFIDGIDVHDLVERRGVLPVKRSIDIIKQVCRALQHALEQGIVHRDIKPANLLVRRDGVVKLADMGLARAVDETMETGLTRAGTTVGTVDYMSPEQARNSKSADVRSDIYSLGCTWYHMLTGTPPFSEGSLTNKLNAHANRPPPDARDKNPSVSEGVVAVMRRMMAKNPDDRYQTPNELIKDLEGALVNKDAVSRKILEALNDESIQGEDDEFETRSSNGTDIDPYPVNMQWSDATVPVKSGPATAVDGDDTHYEPLSDAKSPPDQAKPAPPPATGSPVPEGNASPTKGTAPVNAITSGTTPSRGTINKNSATRPAAVSDVRQDPAAPSRSTSSPAPDNGSKPSPSQNKPAVGTSRPAAGTTKSMANGGRQAPASLPPPRRKGLDDQSDPTASGMSSQVKMALTALGVVVALGAIVFLASLAQRLGDAAAPMIVPVEPALPPPPIQAGNEPPVPGEAVAEAGTRPNGKEALVEHPDSPGESSHGGDSFARDIASLVTDPAKAAPDWVDAAFPANKVHTLHVRTGPTAATERQFGSLSEALKEIPAEGARIVLAHDGPFDLIPIDISGSYVMIEAAQGTRPLIQLVTDGEHFKLPWLNMTGGTLVLDGVDFLGDANAVPASDPWSWVRVMNGHLYVRNSSFTLTGQRSAPTIALKLSGSLTDNAERSVSLPRLLLDHSVVRGDGLQSIQLESPGFEGVVRKSLLVAGAAPAVGIRSSEKAQAGLSRHLRFVTSTVCSNQEALSLSAQGTPSPVQTDLILSGALFAAPAEAHQPVLLALEEWPANTNRTNNAGPYKNLTWTAGASAVMGFHPLLKLHNNDAATLPDVAAWKKAWKEVNPTTFSTLAWPTEAKAGVLASPLKAWSPKTLETLGLTFPVASITPGCPVSDLRIPSHASDTATAVAQPQRPRSPAPFIAKAFVPVDLLKTDLGKLIGSKAWEDGTVFVASGSGQRYSSPITVDRHKWRIQFQQTEGPTLVVSPRGTPRSAGDNGAFITIRGGQLDLERGTFSPDAKDNLSIPPWFLSAEGGGFTLQSCRIAIPSTAGTRNKGIIRWTAASPPDQSASNTDFQNFGIVTDSLLIGNQTLISADLDQSALVLNNSAFVGRQHLFELQVGLHAGQNRSAFDAQNCTYLAGGTQFVIKSHAAPGSSPRPCRMFHGNCVFATLPHDAQSKTAALLLNYTGAVAANSQIQWYEESCGYGPELKAYFATEMALPAAPLAPQDFATEWTKRWGADHVQRPLHGNDGVIFEKNLGPNATAVKPENLKFHSAAKAQSWSETGGPIGARPQSLEPPSAPAKSNPATRKSPNKPPPKVAF